MGYPVHPVELGRPGAIQVKNLLSLQAKKVEGFGERVKSHALTIPLVINDLIGGVEFGEVTMYDECLRDSGLMCVHFFSGCLFHACELCD
jgi:hypothetical protein